MDILTIMQSIDEMKEEDYIEYLAIMVFVKMATHEDDKEKSEYFCKIVTDFAKNLQDMI